MINGQPKNLFHSLDGILQFSVHHTDHFIMISFQPGTFILVRLRLKSCRCRYEHGCILSSIEISSAGSKIFCQFLVQCENIMHLKSYNYIRKSINDSLAAIFFLLQDDNKPKPHL